MLSNSLDDRENNQVKIKGTENYQMPPPYREFTLIKDDNTRDRSSHQRCSVTIEVLRNFAKFTGKHLCQSLFSSFRLMWSLKKHLETMLKSNLKDILIKNLELPQKILICR